MQRGIIKLCFTDEFRITDLPKDLISKLFINIDIRLLLVSSNKPLIIIHNVSDHKILIR